MMLSWRYELQHGVDMCGLGFDHFGLELQGGDVGEDRRETPMTLPCGSQLLVGCSEVPAAQKLRVLGHGNKAASCDTSMGIGAKGEIDDSKFNSKIFTGYKVTKHQVQENNQSRVCVSEDKNQPHCARPSR